MRSPNVPRSAPIPWPAEVDPDHVRQATSGLIAHVSGRVDPGGAIREECRSRVLETALALTLMTRTGVNSPARDSALAFLTAHLDTSQEFDRVLATLAVARAADRASAGDADLIDKLTDALLGAAPEFISARRRRMLYAVLSVLGCPLPPGVVPAADERAPTDPIHSWAAVQQASVTLILASATGVSNGAGDAALRTLTSIRPAATVWEGTYCWTCCRCTRSPVFPDRRRRCAAAWRRCCGTSVPTAASRSCWRCGTGAPRRPR